MSNAISRVLIDPDTGLSHIIENMSEEEVIQTFSNPQLIRDKIAVKQQAIIARQADITNLIDAQADTALADITSDLTSINTALTAFPTATNAQKIDMIQPMLLGLRRILLRQEKEIKVLRWLAK